MRSATCAIGVALVVLAARPTAAPADDEAATSYRAVIDRVDVEPATIGGLRLRVALSALAIGGQRLELDRKSIAVQVGSTKLDAPYALGTYAATGADTAIVVVLQANLAYADALPSLVQTLDEGLLSQLGDHTQLAILPYGDATGTGKLASLKTGRGKLGEVAHDGSASEPALLDTLDRAVLLLKKAKTTPPGRPLRKLIIVIGDGHDRAGDRDRVTSLGKRADREGVRIHTIGYAPTRVLRPLLTLGELSRRSLGTFRWVRAGGTESWSPAFNQLRDEINRQYVLTFFLPADADLAGKKLKVITTGRTQTTSNELKVPEALCDGEPCPNGYCASAGCIVPRGGGGRGVVGWLLLALGGAAVLVVVLGVIGYFLHQRQQALAALAMTPEQLAQMSQGQMPGQVGQIPGMPGPPPPKPSRWRKAQPAPPQPVAPPPITGPSLLVMTGPRAGLRVPLQNGFTIGKAPSSDLVLDDGYTSGQHAQVGVDQRGNCRLYDRNSTNGTFVNGVRVTEVVLDHGMSVRIGSTELRFLAQ
jgi:FHA domain-containing protein